MKKRLFIFLSIIFAALILVSCKSTPVPTDPTDPTVTDTIPTVTEPTGTEPTGGTEPTVTDPSGTEQPDYAAAIAALNAHYAESIAVNGFEVTEDLVLITEIEGLPITWSASPAGFIAADGTVTRPAFGDGNKTVFLKATFAPGFERTFILTVVKLEQTTEEVIDAALAVVTIVPQSNTGYQEENFNAVTKYTLSNGEEVDVTWTTSDATVMTAAGVLVGFEDAPEKSVTLTASITFDGITRTKDVEFLVKGVTTYTSFLTALVTSNKGEKVKVEGVSLYTPIKAGVESPVGYYIASDDNIIAYVHGIAALKDLEYGKLYDVIFEVDIYFGTFQLKNPAFSNERDGDIPVITPVEMSVDDLVNLPRPETVSFNQTLTTLRNVKVVVQDFNDNYKTFLVDKDLPEGTVLTDQNSIMIYYVSNIEVIQGLDGRVIEEINVINNGYRTNNIVWYVNYIGDGSDIVVGSLTPEQTVQAVHDELKRTIPYVIITDDALTLPTELMGATIVWTSDDEDILDPLTGEVVLPEGAPVELQLFATITLEEAELQFARIIWVQTPEALLASTVKEAAEYTDTFKLRPFKVVGVVTGISANNTYTFEDDTGTIAIYTSQKLDIGFEYTIIGERALFNGLVQIAPLTAIGLEKAIIKGDEDELPAGIDLTDVEIKDAEYMNSIQSSLVNISGAEVTAITIDTYGNVTATLKVGTATITLKWDSRVPVSPEAKANITSIMIGDTLNIDSAPLGWYNGPQIGYNDIFQIVIVEPDTDEGKVAAAAAALALPTITNEDLDLITEGRFETVIGWTSSDETVIAIDGKVTLPLVNTAVVLTATISSGAAFVEKEFYVFVQVEEGVLNVRLARELATGAAVVLKGVVSGIGEGRYVYVSDEDGMTINLFYVGGMPEATVGDLVKVTGEIDRYNGLVQVKNGVIEVVSSGNDVPPAVELDKIPVFTIDDQGKRYNIDNLAVVSVSGRSMVVTDGYRNITVYSDLNVTEINDHLASAEGKMVNLKEIHLGWFNNGQFLVYDVAEVEVLELSDDGKIILDLSELSLPSLVSEAGDLEFPATGSRGSVIVWESDKPAVISDTGVVVLPTEEDEVVTITATVVGDETYVKTFEILVKKHSEVAILPATLMYSGANGNLDEAPVNEAAKLNLNPTVFTVLAEKGTAGYNVGVNASGQVRLYSVRATGLGNIFTVKTNPGFSMVSVKFNFATAGNQSTSAELMLGATKITLDQTDLTGTLNYADLDITEFKLTNTHLGGDANGQIWILSIEIMYAVLDGEPPVEPTEPEVEKTTIAEFLASEGTDEFVIEGIITNVGPYNSFSIEDSTGAVALRISGKNSANIDFVVGDKVEATVKKNVFNGLIQAEVVSGQYEIVSSGNALPAVFDANEIDLSAAALLPYQSRLIKLDNLEVTEHSVDSYGTVQMTLKRADGQTIILRWDNRVAVEGIQALKDLEVGATVSVNGATLTWFNAPQLMIDNMAQVIIYL